MRVFTRDHVLSSNCRESICKCGFCLPSPFTAPNRTLAEYREVSWLRNASREGLCSLA